ncbi:MAG: transferrin-binding protein-like solute binding protein [Alphaproteobacteria bacterium]|nr:transferrin-binding protein-like solute binding protein [Alphaproteobacteria bacterium]
MRQTVFSLITLIIFSFILTACGGGGGGGGGDSANTANDPKTPDTPAAEYVTNDPQASAQPDASEQTNVTANGLDGLAIFRDGTTVTPLTNSKLLLTTSGNDISSVTAYVNAKYEATTNGETNDKANIFTGTDATDTTVTLNVNKGSDFFGFQSQEMTHLSWSNGSTIDGVMIAGAETVASTLTSLTDITFTGRGKGVYGDADGGHKTIFTVNATINSTDKTVTFKSTDTCKGTEICTVADTANWIPALNLTTDALSYTSNEISGAITAGGLTGTLDARFYGSNSNELGGIFSLVDTGKSYYFGAFGVEPIDTNVETVSLAALGTAKAGNATQTITDTSDKLDDISGGVVTLQGLAVEYNHKTDYTRQNTGVTWSSLNSKGLTIDHTLTLSPITASAAELNLGGATDSVTNIYVGETYTAGHVDRSEIFGFASDYMAFVTWEVDANLDGTVSGTMQTTHAYDGMMLAGVETAGANLLTEGKADFTGAGKGTYGTKANNSSFDTVFDVTVAVDFGTDVTITTSNTCNATLNASCLDDSDNAVPTLNFTTGALSYTGNNISETNLTIGDLTGTLNARFYGNAAEEFGGTFALAQASTNATDGQYYYGAFGASRKGVAPFVASDTTTVNALGTKPVVSTQATNIGTYESLTAISTDSNGGTAINATLQGLTVLLNDVTTHTRYKDDLWTVDSSELQIDRQITPTRITASATDLAPSSAVSFTFGTDGNATATTIFADVGYTASNTDSINADRSTIFDFASNYMAYISWGKDESFSNSASGTNQTITDIDGIMIAGIETADLTSLSTDGVIFTGKGSGNYGTATESYATVFDVTATVNFDASNVTIASSNTQKTDNTDVSSTLDFSTAAISYTGNSISDTATAGALSGTLDARLYGARAWEFGGTFALADTNATSYYYGAFGAERDGILIKKSELDIAEIATAVSVDPASLPMGNPTPANYDSIVDAIIPNQGVNGPTKVFNLSALTVSKVDTADRTRAPNRAWSTADKDNRNIKLSRVDGAVASLTLNGNGAFSALTVYANSGDTYSIDATGKTLASIHLENDITTDLGFMTDTQTMLASRDGSDTNGALFNHWSDNMINISWTIDESLVATGNKAEIQQRHGVMIAGVEAEAGNIPTSTSIDFTGRGFGYYQNVITDQAYETRFSVTATVDFSEKTVLAKAHSASRCTSAAGRIGCSSNNSYNFNADKVTYTGTDINISTPVTTMGGLTGTLDARFYGYTGNEFGGTFAASDSESYYYGSFGARRKNEVYNIISNVYTIMASISTDDSYDVATPQNESIGSRLSITQTALASNGTKTLTLEALSTNNISNDIDYKRSARNKAWASKADKTLNATSITNIIGSATSISYNNAGEVTAVTAFLNDGTNDFTYTTNGGFTHSNSNTVATAEISNLAGTDFSDATTKTIKVDRSEDSLGFDSNYMALVRWDIDKLEANLSASALADNTYSVTGFMVAGIESADLTILSGSYDFTGKGRGVYESENDKYETVFDVTATVNFDASNVTIASSNTCLSTNADCTSADTNDWKSNLSFNTGAISYIDTDTMMAVNIITDTAVATTGDTILTGRLDARLYAANLWELGGSFALANSNSFYHGAFGSHREGTVTDNYMIAASIGDGTAGDGSDGYNLATSKTETIPTYMDGSNTVNYISLTEAVNRSENSDTLFALQSLATEDTRNKTDYARPIVSHAWVSADKTLNSASIANIIGSGADITFKNGKVNAVTAYLNDGTNDFTYTATSGFSHSSSNTVSTADISNLGSDLSDASTKKIKVDRSVAGLGFYTNYMALVRWDIDKLETDLSATALTDSTANITGLMVAGMETATLPTMGDVTFRGKGQGVYESKTERYDTIFNVTATVDFDSADTVTITTSNTQKTDNTDVSSELDVSTAALDITGNAINGAITTINASDSLAGRLDARFYGADGNEFGGAFALADSNSYYHGAFASYDTHISLFGDDFVSATHADKPTVPTELTDQNSVTYADFDAIWAAADTDMNEKTVILPISFASSRSYTKYYEKTDAVNAFVAGDYVRDDTVFNRYEDSALEITFDNDPYIDDNNLPHPQLAPAASATTLYVGVDKHGMTASSGRVRGVAGKIDGQNTGSRLAVYMTHGGFDAKYAATIYWRIRQNIASDISELDPNLMQDQLEVKDGYGIAGIATAGSSIPTAGSVTFYGAGKAKAQNYNVQSGNKSYSVNVNFTITANVDFADRTAQFSGDADYNGNIDAEWDFRTEPLHYQAGVNHLSGDVYTTKSSTAGARGTIDAKFYGPGAEEMGGAIMMESPDGQHNFIGNFAACKKTSSNGSCIY